MFLRINFEWRSLENVSLYSSTLYTRAMNNGNIGKSGKFPMGWSLRGLRFIYIL